MIQSLMLMDARLVIQLHSNLLQFLSCQRHRNFITTFRADASWSSLYAIQENVFMSIADDKDVTKSEGVYKMLKKEKELLDTFMYAMNTGLKTA